MLLLVPIAHASSAEDADGDGVLDGADRCSEGESSWTSNSTSDVDGDGCKDATEDWDDDSDGFEDHANATRPDACPLVYGTSSLGDVFGCPDADLDGWADNLDAFPYEMTQWSDVDKHEKLRVQGHTKVDPKIETRLVARGDLPRDTSRTDSPTINNEGIYLICSWAASVR